MKSQWMYRKKLKLYEIFRVVNVKEELIAIALDKEKAERFVAFMNEEADDE